MKDIEQIEIFIDVHFDAKHFVSFNLEYQNNITFQRVVCGSEMELTTVDLVSVQFAVKGKVLIVPIHNSETRFLMSTYTHLYM